ncbi:MAG TPA: hypothetical protein VL426_07425 [Candidatus Binatia bacterium]|jgi:hypothetical protein|nr:hypothetical protein [Candidatus Binatia bacterium]
MRNAVRAFLVALIIVLGVLTLGLGYYGFVPGLSAVLGSAKPRDLRVDPNVDDLASAKAKTGITFSNLIEGLPPEQSIKFTGQKELNVELTDEELTALLRSDSWRYNFIEKGQVRINADGTEEISGLLRLDRVNGYLLAHHASPEKFRPYLHALESFSHHPAFYVKLDSSWQDGKLTMKVMRAEIGRYEIEDKVLAAHQEQLRAAIERHVLAVPGITITSLTFGGGRMQYEGTFPETVEWSP